MEIIGALLLLNFKTKCKTGYISTSLVSWGSSWASTIVKFFKESDFLGFSHCFSVRIEQTSKKPHQNDTIWLKFGFF